MNMSKGYVRLTEPSRICPECGGEVHVYGEEDDIYKVVTWCDGCKKKFTYEEFRKLKRPLMRVVVNGVFKGKVQPNNEGITTFPVEWLTDTSKCGETVVSVEVDVSDKEE